MNLVSLTTRAMEVAGVRKLSLVIARLFGLHHPPPASSRPEQVDWTHYEFVAFQQDARYSLVANGIRSILTVPLVYATFRVEAGGWIPYLAGTVLSLHLLVVLVDCYRLNLVRMLEPYAKPNRAEPRRSPAITFKTSGYFKPQPFENAHIYRMLGLEWFRRVVVWFVESAKLRGDDAKKGIEVHFVEGSNHGELIQFEAATRTAEAIHLLCVLWNLPILWLLAVAHSPWAIVAGLMVFLDAYLVLLQRYHRARVWALIHAKIERSGPRGSHEPLEDQMRNDNARATK